MGKNASNTPGYSFPRMPERWSEGEKQFGLGLRDQFDRLYSQNETANRQYEANKTDIENVRESQQKYADEFAIKMSEMENRMSGAISEGDASIEGQIQELSDEVDAINETLSGVGTSITEINTSITGINKDIDDLEDGLDDLETDILRRISTVYNEIYPTGIIVLGGSSCPITFGTWTSELTDPGTGDPVPDADGNYRWRRVV